MIRTNHVLLEYANSLYEKQLPGEHISIKKIKRSEILLQQNMPSVKVIIVIEGITKCYIDEENNKTFIIEFLGKGEIIGELECIRNMPCLCSVEAITDVSVFLFSIPFFRHLLQTDLKLNEYLLNSFAERIVNTSVRSSFQQLYTVEHSLKALLHMQAKNNITLSKEEIASYLGITVRTLNRSLKNLVE